MARLPVDEVLKRIERPVAPRPEFADELLAAFLRELELEPETREQPRSRGPRRLRRPARGRGPLAAAAAAVLVAIVALVIVVPSSRQTALAVIEQAQQDFAEVPSFHATWSRRVSGDSEIFHEFGNDHKGEDWVQVQEFWYDGNAWRREIVKDTLPFIRGGAGSFMVFDGQQTGVYRAHENTVDVREGEGVEFSPLIDLSPVRSSGVANLIQTRAGPGMRFDTYFEQRCQTLPDGRVAGRAARHLTCEGGFAQLWLDADTGIILRFVNPEFELEVESIEYEPSFSPGLFQFEPLPDAEKPAEAEADGSATSLITGDVVPAWTGPLVSGGKFDLVALRGKPSAVYFWASWCPPCIGGPLDDLESVYKERADELNFVSVSSDTENAMRNFLDEEGPYQLPIVLDEEGDIVRDWGVAAVPILVLLDADLRFQGAFRGPVSAQDLRSLLDALASGESLPPIDREDG